MLKGRNLLIAIVGVLAVLYYSLVTYVVPSYIKQMLPTVEMLAQDYINGSVRIGGLSWGGGLSAQVDNVVVEDTHKQKVAELPKTVVHFRPWLILGGVEKVVTKIELLRPQAFLIMDEEQNWNMQSLLKPSDSEETPFYGLLQITDGILQVQLPNGKWNLQINGDVDGGANPNFAVDADVVAGSDKLKLQGTINTKGLGTLTLKTDTLDVEPYSPAIEYLEQIYDNSGKLTDLRLHWSNDGKRVQLDGKGNLMGVTGKLKLEDKLYAFKLDGAISAVNNIISLHPLDMELAGQKLRLEAVADLADMNDLEAVKVKGKLHYGEGEVAFNGSYSEAVAAYLADASFKNIRINLPDGTEDAVTINGDVAVLAKAQDGAMDVQAAADAFDLQWRSLRVHKAGFDGRVDKQGLNINHFSVMAGKSGNLIAQGKVGNDGSLQLSGRMAEFPIDPFLDVAGQHGSGLCSTGFDIGGTVSAPQFAGIIQFTDIDFMQQRVDEAHGLVAVGDNLVTIKDFVANMQQGRHIINGNINLQGAEPVVDLSLETYGVRAEPLVALAAPDVKLTGNVDNVVQVQGSLSNPSVNGEVCLTDGSAEGYLLDKVQGRYSYHEGQLDLRNFTVDALSAELFLDGTLSKNQDLDFKMQAHNVSLERLPVMASDVDLQGFIALNGALTGTLTYPRFTGGVSSKQIKVNGETLSELSGSLDANGRNVNKLNVRFKQPYVDDSSNYGLFTADLNLDLVNKYMRGKVLTLWGNLGGILRMAKQDYAIDGTAQGELDFNPRGKGSGVDIEILVDDVKIHDLDYYRMLFKGQLVKGVLTMDDVRLQEQQEFENQGIITLDGTVDLRGKKLDLNMSAVQANPAVVTALMSDPPPITGKMDLQLDVNGTFDNPSGRANVNIINGSISGVGMASLQANAVLVNDNIKFENFSAMNDIYGLRAAGDIPMDLFRSSETRRNPNAQMKIAIDLEDARLGMLPAMTKLVEWGAGDTEGKLSLEGTLEEPLVYGSVKIAEGSVKLRDLVTVIDKIHTDIEFKGNEILLHDLSAQLGKGSIVANGNYALRADDAEPYSLRVLAQDAELSSEIFTGTINSSIEITPQKYRDRAKRQGNRPAPTAYRPLIKGSVKLDDVLVNMPTIPEMGEGGSNLGLDMQIDLGKKIHFFNKYLYDIWLSGKMHIKGSTVYPMIDGQIKADKGSVTYLRTPFKLKNTSVNWIQPGTFLPNVNLESEARFSRYDIYMRINGPLEEMDLQLSSNPPLEKNTIVRMLTLQRDSAGSDDVSSEDMANLMTAGLQMTVLGDVEMLLKQTLGLDQFRIYTGKVRSGIGFESVRDRNQELTPEERNQYNMLVSKYLGSKFMAGYTTSFDGIDRSIFGQYDINRHLNVTYSRSYDLSDEAEDWFGLEYKVSFN